MATIFTASPPAMRLPVRDSGFISRVTSSGADAGGRGGAGCGVIFGTRECRLPAVRQTAASKQWH